MPRVSATSPNGVWRAIASDSSKPGSAYVPDPVMIPTMARDATPWILLYDEDCGFCRWSLSWVLRADRRRVVEPLPLGTPEADRLLAHLAPAEREASWHLSAPDDRRWSAGYAAAPLLRLLPGGRLPAFVLGA